MPGRPIRVARGAAALAALLALACGGERKQAPPGAAAPGATTPAASMTLSSDGSVVARLNGEPLSRSDLLGGQPRGMRPDPDQALDAAIARRLAAQEARRRGLADGPEVRAQLEALKVEAAAREEALLRDALYQALQAEIQVSEAELHAQYERSQARFSERRLRLRRMSFPSAEAARAEDARLGPDGRLDPQRSEEIGPATLQQLMQQMIPGMMRLHEPGQRIVVERPDRAALVELVEVLPAQPAPFEEVRAQVEAEVRAQRSGELFARLVDELRAKAKLEVDKAALHDEAAWRALPAAQPTRPLWR